MQETPQLPVAATSQRPLRAVEEAPPKPALVFLHTDALRDLQTRTCVQCGINPAGPPKKRVLQHVPPWVYLGLLANVVILGILYFAGRRRVNAVFRLCPDCAAADARARRLRGISLAGLLVFPAVGATIGAAIGDAGVILGGASAGVVAAIAGIVAAATKTRHELILTKNIDKKAGTVTLLASPTWHAVLDAEARDALATTPR
jgi:hypothetical protein